MNAKQEQQWWRDHFPSPAAREAADRAVDALPPTEDSMRVHIDTWIAAYVTAGGRIPKRDEL